MEFTEILKIIPFCLIVLAFGEIANWLEQRRFKRELKAFKRQAYKNTYKSNFKCRKAA